MSFRTLQRVSEFFRKKQIWRIFIWGRWRSSIFWSSKWEVIKFEIIFELNVITSKFVALLVFQKSFQTLSISNFVPPPKKSKFVISNFVSHPQGRLSAYNLFLVQSRTKAASDVSCFQLLSISHKFWWKRWRGNSSTTNERVEKLRTDKHQMRGSKLLA